MRQLFLALFFVLVTGPHANAEGKRPNILFIIFDDWNGSTHAGAYGCDWIKTPPRRLQLEMQPVPRQHPDRAQYLAAEGRGVARGLLSGGV